MDRGEVDRIIQRWALLKTERASWMGTWRDIARYMQPRAGRLLNANMAPGTENRGERRDQDIIDNTATNALRTLGSGLMAGMTSPARPWFQLTTSDPKLDASQPVKEWLDQVRELMEMVFRRSNTYQALHACYEELGAFGTCATVITSNVEDVLYHHSMTVGEYFISTDYNRTVDTLYREFQMTVGQMVGQFGLKNCSIAVQNLHTSGRLDTWMPILHAIEPRHNRDISKRDSINMAWRSVYLEPGGGLNVLREGGFDEFPALAARWQTYGSDIYGTSPAMQALGDTKQLQHQQKRKSQAIDYMTMPPLQAPSSLKNQQSNLLPGGLTYVDAVGPQQAVRSMFDVRIELQHLLADMQDVRGRINSAFYADLFLMLYARGERDPRMTATEVAERHEEKLLMIGPVLERLHHEMLAPKIELAFSHMVRAGIVPPAPPELEGRDLNVEFVSVLAQAQRAVATNSIDRFVSALGMVAQAKPEVLDKFDADKWADEYADALGISPNLIVPGDQVVLIRQQRAQQQQAVQQAAMAEQAAGAAAKLGGVDTSQPNALTDTMAAFSGYS